MHAIAQSKAETIIYISRFQNLKFKKLNTSCMESWTQSHSLTNIQYGSLDLTGGNMDKQFMLQVELKLVRVRLRVRLSWFLALEVESNKG